MMGRGKPQGGGDFLQGGGSCNTTVWVGDVGPFGRNREEGVSDSHWVP